MKISETFYSIQGEGVSQGVPSYFIRLKGCNLMCGGEKGSLMKAGKATWYCDTEDIWKNGIDVSNEELLARMKKEGILENILSGLTHIVWTGGEPALPRNRKDIAQFLEILPGRKVFNELETNGTIETDDNFYSLMQQINCSPKLQNSGMSYERRVNKNALNQIMSHPNSWFKFVISSEGDISEIKEAYLAPFKIPNGRVILMPAVDNLEELAEKTRKIYELAKKYGYRATTRTQILAWNKTTGV